MLQQERPLEARRPEGQDDQRIHEERIEKVNGQIDDMVAGDISAMEPVIEGEAEKADGPVQFEDIGERAQVPDKGNVRDAPGVIELKGYLEGVGIGNEANENDQNRVKIRIAEIG